MGSRKLEFLLFFNDLRGKLPSLQDITHNLLPMGKLCVFAGLVFHNFMTYCKT